MRCMAHPVKRAGPTIHRPHSRRNLTRALKTEPVVSIVGINSDSFLFQPRNRKRQQLKSLQLVSAPNPTYLPGSAYRVSN